jgi:hypothetical protein
VLRADIQAALVADADHGQARVGHVMAPAPDDQFGDALDIGTRAQRIVVMDAVIHHPARPRDPARAQEADDVDDRADHPHKGCDQGNQHWQQMHSIAFRREPIRSVQPICDAASRSLARRLDNRSFSHNSLPVKRA